MALGFDKGNYANTTVFVVRNIADKTLNLFGVPVPEGAEYNLMKIPYVSESDIRMSLVKGFLNNKISNNEIVVVESNIDLLQFDPVQKTKLKDAGVEVGTSAGGSAGNEIVLLDGSMEAYDSEIEFKDSTFTTINTGVNINGQLAVTNSGVIIDNVEIHGTLTVETLAVNNIDIDGTLSVGSNVNLANNTITVTEADGVNIDGILSVSGNVNLANSTITVTEADGVNIDGYLSASGAASFSGVLNVIPETGATVSGSFTANSLTAGSATITNTINAATANISGTCTMATGNITGTLTANAVNVTTTINSATVTTSDINVTSGTLDIGSSVSTFTNGTIIQAGTNRFIDTSLNSGNIRLKVAPEAHGAITSLVNDDDVDLDVVLSENGFYTFTVICFVKLASAGTYRKIGAIVSAKRVSGTLTLENTQVDLNLGALDEGVVLALSSSSGNLRCNIANTTGETVNGRIHVGWECEDLL